jgi:hypothetical protein
MTEIAQASQKVSAIHESRGFAHRRRALSLSALSLKGQCDQYIYRLRYGYLPPPAFN